MATALHHAPLRKEQLMVNLVVNSAAARVLRGLVGTVLFVQASQYVSWTGLLVLALGSVLIITAGVDVAPRPAETAGHE